MIYDAVWNNLTPKVRLRFEHFCLISYINLTHPLNSIKTQVFVKIRRYVCLVHRYVYLVPAYFCLDYDNVSLVHDNVSLVHHNVYLIHDNVSRILHYVCHIHDNVCLVYHNVSLVHGVFILQKLPGMRADGWESS
jgi:hypothetical protein